MVPEAYHAFFGDAAEVAGALIGLLFVAVSVAPEHLRAHDVAFRTRAGIAFAALTNCLFVTLIATLPSAHLANAATVLSVAGLTFCAWLGWLAVHHGGRAARAAALLRVAALVGIFVGELLGGLRLAAAPDQTGAVATISYLVLGGFGVAIERSWELVGASGTSVLAHVERILAARREATPDAERHDD